MSGFHVPSPSPMGSSPSRYNEVNAISTACSYGIPECQELATSLFQQWQNTNKNT